MRSVYLGITIVTIVLLKNALSSNILFILPLPSPSHYLWNKILALELVKHGYNITVIAHDIEKDTSKNFTVITIEGFYEYSDQHIMTTEYIQETNILKSITDINRYVDIICRYDLNSTGFKTLMNYPNHFKFDLIVFDITNPVCLYSLIPRFNNPPVVGVSPFMLSPHLMFSFGSPLYTSYMPYYYTMFTNHMTFKERFLTFIYSYLDIINHRYVAIPNQNAIVKEAFGDTLPSLEEIERNISLLLVNSDHLLDYPIPLVPNIIPVGGLHSTPARVLPQDLEKIFNAAKNGVILFSLGTNIKWNMLSIHHITTFLKVFSKLEEVVLWKFETGDLENVPENVIIRKWLPQNDVLGHPKTKLFISHCGGLSSHEAMYHGVPVVAMPFFIDQNMNAAKLLEKGMAIYLDHRNISVDKVYSVIKEILENPIYKQNTKKISERYRNQPQTALERAVFWIEYVLQYGNVDHLDVPGRDMSTIQIWNLDIIAVIIICFVLIYLAVLLLIRVFKILYFSRHEIVKEKKL